MVSPLRSRETISVFRLEDHWPLSRRARPTTLVGLRPPCASGRGVRRSVSFMVGIVVETSKVVSHETVYRSRRSRSQASD